MPPPSIYYKHRELSPSRIISSVCPPCLISVDGDINTPRLPSYNIRIPSFGHAGDGNLHVYICRDDLNDADWESKKDACFDRMYEKAVALGGLVSGEHGIGYAKKEFLKRQYGEVPIALMQGIKQVFDPRNILNPGKVCF